ncbi:FAD-dependent oxidoreductase [Mycobacteroides immunogenum]|uniref:FAD-binding domain-containing protein n=1 Tax=Mycobacteroides immunogenum TaxID=83262 RepID=A0A7V8LT94_9MYCO|nr:FAD-dependent oxidoreductase [Mycobacteroides immunogenum]AMT73325.1 hypothetical protein ABG82_26715 [Mycobacteroides immunogenum]ANO06487.1 hypothetical protein BAB75_26975 [Mycobacteroides immunogenum]KIU39715.1 hypothetical protein TL11_15190 [Mycobacteroides immunogenum]KPG10719.1 hypothetical protein AN909_10240 [Mycobacteroides immunogenum]KPG12856.1 hypothetical protein AN910_10935 [Mycobacteroides immunogenum]
MGDTATGGWTDADCDVLVIGGGLVGLTTAMFLAQQDVRTIVVERHEAIKVLPKARNLSIRTMELFREAGIEDVVRAAGDVENLVGIGDTLAGEYERVFRPADVADPEGQSPVGPASCEQYRLEPILRRHCEELGATVLFGHRAVTIAQHEDSVTVDVLPTGGTGATSFVARYLVVADGANGTFRQVLGIGRHGQPYPGTGLSIQFEADLAPALGSRDITAFLSPERDALIFLRGRARDYHLLALPPRVELDGMNIDSSGAQAIPFVNAVLGVDNIDIDVVGAGVWHTGSYVAERYRAGRAFLVGDAAHINSPHGGYGANTGIAEAHNLAWKIAAVLRGDAEDALLDTYETERKPIAEYTVLEVREMARKGGYIGEGNPGPVNVTLGFRYPAAGATGYDPLSPVQDATASYGEPGTRVPHVELIGDITSTLDLVDPRGFTLLAPESSVYAAALHKDPLPRVGARTIAEEQVIDKARWHRIFPTPEHGALLVRPDGVVAARFESAAAAPRQAVEQSKARVLRPSH